MKMKPLKLLTLLLLLAGTSCLWLFNQSDRYIDAQGFLQEPFALLGGGYLLLGLGLLMAVAQLIQHLIFPKK